MRITYPALPVAARRAEIAAAISAHQVVIVAGETGSGKTTQLPKICLELGRERIAHTQPRRIAARTVAARIADELSTPLGELVGYTVRFTDRASARTQVRVMTDGILLAEIARDPQLRRYDTIIIDEAHERSLNIDFLLGYLTRLIRRRPELKLVITSATIEPERFAEHFRAHGQRSVPIVEVSGRSYPVEIRYRPLADGRDQVEGIVDAVGELRAAGPGDILVFLSGEREIRDTADALRGLRLADTEVLPLYARLSTGEQQRVFADHPGRRIVLATNVAETSLTVPGIKYVVDPGTARISRYSRRTKVQRLPIEAISQASATQRAGRCGRTADGICVRLYDEEDFRARPEHTEPEILRTNLASVILQMAAGSLGDIATFPFVQPPDRRAVRDGVAVLRELAALDETGRITPLGRKLARLPVDPRLARMITQAQAEDCVGEVLVIAAALSIPDPRERPADAAAQADQAHARFADPRSDFLAYLNLWRYLAAQRASRSGNQFRRMCREEHLNYLRTREWQDLVGQLHEIAASIGIKAADADAGSAPAGSAPAGSAPAGSAADEPVTEPVSDAESERIHRALLAGLLSHIGMRDTRAENPPPTRAGGPRGRGGARPSRDYLGAHSARFVIAPGSALARRPPPWVVAAELVETSRLFARVCARIAPETVEQLAGHLLARSHSEPHWDPARAAVMAVERVSLYGLPLVTDRLVGYAAIDPPLCRELFIRHALVEGDWQPRHEFFAANAALRAELAEIEDRARRRDLLVGDEEVFAFFNQRIPAEVVSGRHFDAWWKKARHERPGLLTLTRDDLVRDGSAAEDFPDTWHDGELALPLSYRFDPGAPDDGVTVQVPVAVLSRLGGGDFGWQVPALREDLLAALIRSLPKHLRRNFVPIADTARALLAAIGATDEPLLDALQRELHTISGILIPRDAFDLDRVPAHLRVTFAVRDPSGELLGQGKDLSELQRRLAEQSRAAVAAAAGVERRGLRDWPADLERLPAQVAAGAARGYPALADESGAVAIRVFANPTEQAVAMAAGTRRLLRLATASPTTDLTVSARSRLLGLGAVLADCADAAVDDIMARHGGPAWTRAGFEELRAAVRAELPALTRELARAAEQVLAAAHEARSTLPSAPPPSHRAAIEDIREQLDELLPAGFVTATGRARLGDLPRYLLAIRRRLDKLAAEPGVDAARMARVHHVRAAYRDLVAALPAARAEAADVRDIRWSIEELRVSLFAQQLGTARPVSDQRVYRAIDAITP
ncbi:MAG: ATP-dependent RNA helicase HrpA [Actinomycetia bacterium]|nr:ATP-dependent RNA helicase HrpA [Actinomycetes bacterium]